MNIMVLKMQSGDELISELVEEAEDFAVLKRPRVLQIMQTQQGMQMGLVPWLISAPESECVVMKDSFATWVTAPEDIAKAYMQQVSQIQLLG
jgi:hypothetical protein